MRYIVILSLLVAIHTSCSSGSDSEESSASEQGGRLAINGLIDAAPAEVQVASPTTATGDEVSLTSGTIAVGLTQENDQPSNSFLGKLIAFINQANGNSDSCLPDLEVTLPTQPGCYNQIVFKNESNGTTSSNIFFDDSILPRNIDNVNAVGVLDDGSGILKESEESVPCSKAVTEYYLDRIASSFDRAQSVTASLLCVAKQSAIETLPSAGESLDLVEEAGNLWSDIDVHVAKIDAISSDSGIVYNTILSISYETEAGDNQDLVVDMLNIPESEGSENYRGRLFIYDKRKSNPDTGPIPTYISSQFEKTSENITILTKDVGLNFVEEPLQFLNTKGMIDFGLFTSETFSVPENQAGGPSIGLLNFNTTDGTGTVSFQSSPALGGTEVSNSFIVTVDRQEDDSLKGCALQGHGLSPVNENGMQREDVADQNLSAYRIQGFYCMKGQQTNTLSFGEDLSLDQFQNQFAAVQKQCFSLKDSTWSILDSNITYMVEYNESGACGSTANDNSKYNLVDLDTALKSVNSSIFDSPPDTTNFTIDKTIDYGLDFEYVP